VCHGRLSPLTSVILGHQIWLAPSYFVEQFNVVTILHSDDQGICDIVGSTLF